MKPRLLQLAVVLLVMLIVGYFVVQHLDFRSFAQLWGAADLRLLAAGFAAYLLADLLRARRFRALTGDRISTLAFLRAVVIQNFLNTFLPLRAGEASYLFMVHRSGTVKPGENLASLLGARALDAVTALLIPLVTLPLSSAWAAEGRTFVWFAAAAALATATLALGIWRAEAVADWLLRRADSRSKLLERALRLGADALRALAQLRRASLLGRVGALTIGCWVLIYLSGYFSLLGVGVRLGFWDSLFAYSFPMIASMTPFYMLGGFGVFEGSVGVGLKLVGVPLQVGMAAGVLLHVAELAFVTLPAPFGLELRRSRVRPPLAEPKLPEQTR